MSLFEWLGESFNPGPIGSVDVGTEDPSDRSRDMVIVSFLLATAALAGWVYLVLAVFEVHSPEGLVGCGIGTLRYLAGSARTLGILGNLAPWLIDSYTGLRGGACDNPRRTNDGEDATHLFG